MTDRMSFFVPSWTLLTVFVDAVNAFSKLGSIGGTFIAELVSCPIVYCLDLGH